MSTASTYMRYAIADGISSRPALAVVTGGRSGIGKAIADKLATLPFIQKVLLVSRSIQPKDVEDNPKFVSVAADIGTEEGRQSIVRAVESERRRASSSSSSSSGGGGGGDTPRLRYLVHSAGTIDPIKSIVDVTQEELRQAMVVNLEGPLLLSTALYRQLSSTDDDDDDDSVVATAAAGRILHVSSGAAHGPPPVGWGAYGISKAAFFQAFQTLDNEFVHLGGKVRVGSFKPGIVDTEMQGVIRMAPETHMPDVGTFHNLKANATAAVQTKDNNADHYHHHHHHAARPPPKGALDRAENVSCFAEWLLLGTTDNEFVNRDDPTQEYDIRDASLYPKWIDPEQLRPIQE